MSFEKYESTLKLFSVDNACFFSKNLRPKLVLSDDVLKKELTVMENGTSKNS